MTERIEITVAGEAVAKQRPRATRTGRMYTPLRTVAAQARLAYAGQAAMNGRQPIADPVRMTIEIGVVIPASWSRRRRSEAIDGLLLPAKKPDLDNTTKLIADGLSGVVYLDDKQICELVVAKHYAAAPGMRITVEAIDATPVQHPEEISR